MENENPFAGNPFYKPKGQRLVGDIVEGKVRRKPETPTPVPEPITGGVEIETQDVRSEEVITDEPVKKPRKRRASRKKRTTRSKSAESSES